MKIIIVLLFSISFIHGFCQNSPIIGKVYDKSTNKPICFSNISYKNTGTSTNEIGFFVMKTKSEFSVKDSIKISCVGYSTKKIAFKDLKLIDTNLFFLEPIVYVLNATNIDSKRVTPYDILQDAFDKVKINNVDSLTYYKATYYELETDSFNTDSTHFQEMYISAIFEEPDYNEVHYSTFGVKENYYILGAYFNTNYKEIRKTTITVPNQKYILEENPIRYKPRNLIFKSERDYHYAIRKTYFDSLLNINMLILEIEPIDTNSYFGHAKVFMSSGDHKIFRIDYFYDCEKDLLVNGKESENLQWEMNYSNSVEYVLNISGKMELKRITSEKGSQFVNTITHQRNGFDHWKCELKIIEKSQLNPNEITKLPKLENSESLFYQKIINDKKYWLDYNVFIKE